MDSVSEQQPGRPEDSLPPVTMELGIDPVTGQLAFQLTLVGSDSPPVLCILSDSDAAFFAQRLADGLSLRLGHKRADELAFGALPHRGEELVRQGLTRVARSARGIQHRRRRR